MLCPPDTSKVFWTIIFVKDQNILRQAKTIFRTTKIISYDEDKFGLGQNDLHTQANPSFSDK